MSILAEFGTGEVLWSIVWFTLFFLWIWVLMSVFADIFRSDDLGGWGKALWIIFIVAIVFIASQLAARTGGSNESRASCRPPSAEPPLDIARRRYAAGEISREDFEQIKRDVG